MNRLGAFVLICAGFYALSEGDRALFVACLGWACALVNRAELDDFKREEGR